MKISRLKIKRLRQLAWVLLITAALIFFSTGGIDSFAADGTCETDMGLQLPFLVEAYAAEGVCTTEGSVMTVSGSFDEDLTIPAGIDRIVLNGVTFAENRELIIDTEAVLELVDGTENSVDMLEVKGYVSVQGGGNLHLTSGMVIMGASIIFNHEGEIKSDGPIACVSGNMTVNSGTIIINNDEADSSGFVCLEGNITINGGNVSVNTNGSAVSAYGSIILNGGTVHAQSKEGVAFLAEGETAEISVADTLEGAQEAKTEAGEGDFGVYYTLSADGEEAGSMVFSGDSDAAAIKEANALFEEQSRLKTKERAAAAEATEEEKKEAGEDTGYEGDAEADNGETSEIQAGASEPADASADGGTADKALSGGALAAIVAAVLIAGAAAAAIIFGRKKK